MFLIDRINQRWMFGVIALFGFAGSVLGQSIQGTDTGFGGSNSITGTVLAPSGQRMQGRVTVRLASMAKGDRVAVTDDGGNFAFRGLPNGDFQLFIDKEKDFEPFSQNVNVFQMRGAPGGNYMISIRLKYRSGGVPKPGVLDAGFANVPEAAAQFYKKGAALVNSGDPKGAIEQFKLAVTEHPRFALAYNDMGVQYLKLNDLGRADDSFKTALNIDPDLFQAKVNHGIVLFEIKKYSEAASIFSEVVKTKDDSAVGHYFLGQSLAYLGKFSEAQKELQRALELGGEPMAISLKEAHRLLAIIYSTQNDKKRQAAELEVYLKLAPNTPDAEQLRQLIARLKGQ